MINHKLYGRRILHVMSPVRWRSTKYMHHADSNYKVMMKTIHSYWAYLVLVILIATVVNALIGLIKNRKFSDKDLRLGFFTLIFSHIQHKY